MNELFEQKNRFEEPEIEIVILNSNDILCASLQVESDEMNVDEMQL